MNWPFRSQNCWQLTNQNTVCISIDQSEESTDLKLGPRRCLAKQRMVVVLPTPGGPAMMMLGTLPSLANTLSLLTVSWLPTISWNIDKSELFVQKYNQSEDSVYLEVTGTILFNPRHQLLLDNSLLWLSRHVSSLGLCKHKVVKFKVWDEEKYNSFYIWQ